MRFSSRDLETQKVWKIIRKWLFEKPLHYEMIDEIIQHLNLPE